MALLKDGRLVDDPWVRVDGDIAGLSHALVPLAQWQAQREAWLRHDGRLGVLLDSDEGPEAIAEDLPDLDLVALTFPKFTDGRAYSAARVLRARYGFRGELRAVGQVLRDQLAFMQRVGFDAYELPDDADVDAWRAAFVEIGPVYQPAADRRRPAYTLRQARPAAAAASDGGAVGYAAAQGPMTGAVAAHWAY